MLVTAPEQPPQEDQDPGELETAITTAISVTLAAWLASVAAAVLAGGGVAVSAIPLPATFVARALTRMRPHVLSFWARVMDRYGVRDDTTAVVERVVSQIGGWLDFADEHAYQVITAILTRAQSDGVDIGAQRRAVRRALAIDYPAWQTWVTRAASLSAGLVVEEAEYAAIQADVGVWEKTWRSRRDDRVRLTHREADDGVWIPAGSRFIVGGAPMLYPHDPTAPLSETMACRCRARYRRA